MKPVTHLLNRLPNAKERAYSFSIKLEMCLDGNLSIAIIPLNHTSVSAIYSILCFLVVVNSICASMPFAHLTNL